MSIKTGETYRSDFIAANEGPAVEFTQDRFNLVLQLNGISEGEVREFERTADLKLALFQAEGIVFLLVDVPGLIGWSDAPYSVWTFPQNIWPHEKTNGSGPRLKLSVVLVELKNRTVLGVKELSLSEEFSNHLLTCVNLQREKRLEPEEILKRIAKVQKKFPTEKMLEKCLIRE